LVVGKGGIKLLDLSQFVKNSEPWFWKRCN
jgi:hypothetical protein